MDIWEHINNLTQEKVEFDEKNDEQVKSYDIFMIDKIISFCEFYVPLANQINRYSLPKSAHYRYYLNALPKRKQYFKYIKKPKDDKKEERLAIQKYFECGKKEAENYLYMLEDEQIEKITNMYKTGVVKKSKE